MLLSPSKQLFHNSFGLFHIILKCYFRVLMYLFGNKCLKRIKNHE